MAIAYVSAGTMTNGTTTITPGTPASLADGDGVLVFIATKPDTATFVTPANWTLVASVSGGGGTSGNGIGPSAGAWFFREKDASWTTIPTFTITGGTRGATQAYRLTKSSSALWDVAASTGVYGTSGTTTAVSSPQGSNPGIAAGDLVLMGVTSMAASPTWSAQAFTATGAVFAAATELNEAIELGTNPVIGGMTAYAAVTSGTASANPTITATASVATRGTASLVRLREIAITSKSASDGAAITITESSDSSQVSLSRTDTASIAVGEGRDYNKGIDNRATNPSFETGLGSVLVANNAITRVQDVTAWDGEYLTVATSTASGGSGTSAFTESTPVLPNTQYTVAMRFRLRSGTVSGSPRMGIRLYDRNGVVSQSININLATLDSNWQTSSFTITTDADVIDLRLGYVNTLGTVHEVDMDGVQVNLGPTLLTYDPATNVTVSKSGSESTAITVTESTDLLKTLVASDGAAISVSDTSALLNSPTATDAAAVTVSESSTVSVTNTTTDTSALGVTEATSVSVSLSRTDTAAITITESTVVDKNLNPSESVAISVTEATAIAVTLSTTDTSALSVAETTSSFRDIVVSDTPTISMVDLSSILSDVAMPGQDTTSLAVVETASVVVFTTRTDTLTIGLTETQASDVAFSSNDGGVIIGTESASLSTFSLISGTDTGALGVTETRTIDSTLSRTDTTALSVSETTASDRTMVAADAAALSVDETAGNAVTLSDDDSADLAVDESVHLFRQGVRSDDTLTLSLDEDAVLTKEIASTEIISLAVDEISGLGSTLPGTDTTTLGVSESVSIYATTVASDSSALGVDETTATEVSLSRSDSATVSVADGGSLFSAKDAFDGGTFMLTEVGDDSVIGAESTSDTATFGVVEVAAVTIGLAASDSGAIATNETNTQTVSVFSSDGNGLRVAETKSQSVTVERSDTVSIGVVENANAGQSDGVSATDAGSLAVDESSSILSILNRYDNGSISLTESITSFGSRPGADLLVANLVETAFVAVFIDDSRGAIVTNDPLEPIALSVTEQVEVKIPVEAIDGGSLGVVDSGQAVGREVNTVLVLVYEQGQWITGTWMEYRAGQWHVGIPHAFREGEWISD